MRRSLTVTVNHRSFIVSCCACLVVALSASASGHASVIKRSALQNAGPPDSQPRVSFTLREYPNAKTVSVAGTFNSWDPKVTPLTKKGSDWSTSLILAPGNYEYKFVIDGTRWIVDPANPQFLNDGNGNFNSIIFSTGENSSNLAPKGLKPGLAFLGRRVDVGGYKLYLNCKGRQRNGEPVLVMDAGLGDSSERWLQIQSRTAEFARVCIYDRAGLGNSDPTTHTQTSKQIAEDLHVLLERSRVKAPLVLVGHSFGGINVRMYASLYPKEVVGMVLVDSAHEEQFARTEAIIPAEIKSQLPPDAFVLMSNEKVDLDESTEQSRQANWHADIPLIVLTAANARPAPEGPLAPLAPKFEQIRQELQQDLVHRSALGKQIVATKSGHYIQRDEPELVLSAIREVLDATRKRK